MLSVKAIWACILENKRVNQQWGSSGIEKNSRSNQREEVKGSQHDDKSIPECPRENSPDCMEQALGEITPKQNNNFIECLIHFNI